MMKLPLSKLNDFFKAIACEKSLYLPVDSDGGAKFKEWKEGCTYSTALNTNQSAKDFFFPQTENMFEMKMNGKKVEVIDNRKESEDFVVFGIRGCDVKSFDILDNVFLSDPVDTYYKTRREHGIIISMACTKPAHTCFCNHLSIDAANPLGDITCWIADDALYAIANTEKGKKLLESDGKKAGFVDAGKDGESVVENQKKAIAEAIKALPVAFKHGETFSEKNLMKLFNSKEWASLSESCIACGTCTFVCPTCQCYDIRDFDTGNGIKRFRCWDSCMYSDFTLMAHGNNRNSQLERFRQRFMHKLVYQPANTGVVGCVGCGRCLVKCPISMNIVKVSQSLLEDAKAGS
ncbi:MAG: 4Fe-4S dicluster domain-containing protein [Treponemataceae bacterium]